MLVSFRTFSHPVHVELDSNGRSNRIFMIIIRIFMIIIGVILESISRLPSTYRYVAFTPGLRKWINRSQNTS